MASGSARHLEKDGAPPAIVEETARAAVQSLEEAYTLSPSASIVETILGMQSFGIPDDAEVARWLEELRRARDVYAAEMLASVNTIRVPLAEPSRLHHVITLGVIRGVFAQIKHSQPVIVARVVFSSLPLRSSALERVTCTLFDPP